MQNQMAVIQGYRSSFSIERIRAPRIAAPSTGRAGNNNQ
jgi:hypothetical protein